MSDETGTFDIDDYAEEIRDPSADVGTQLLFENGRVRVWEIRLEPGERAPFHRHEHPYFYVCVQPSRVRTRFPNGVFAEGDEDEGGVAFMDHSSAEPGIHDLENAGSTTLRYVTVELL